MRVNALRRTCARIIRVRYFAGVRGTRNARKTLGLISRQPGCTPTMTDPITQGTFRTTRGIMPGMVSDRKWASPGSSRAQRVEKRREDERADELKKLVNARGDSDILERECRDCSVYAMYGDTHPVVSHRLRVAHKHTYTHGCTRKLTLRARADFPETRGRRIPTNN